MFIYNNRTENGFRTTHETNKTLKGKPPLNNGKEQISKLNMKFHHGKVIGSVLVTVSSNSALNEDLRLNG